MKIETFGDYAKLLPKEVREKFLANIERQHPGRSKQTIRSVLGTGENVICGGFLWSDTPEGHRYWWNVEEDMLNLNIDLDDCVPYDDACKTETLSEPEPIKDEKILKMEAFLNSIG